MSQQKEDVEPSHIILQFLRRLSEFCHKENFLLVNREQMHSLACPNVSLFRPKFAYTRRSNIKDGMGRVK